MALDPSVVRRSIAVVVVAGVVLIAIALLLPAVQQAREAARRSQSQNNLKQFWLGLHTYHDSFNCFPPGGTFEAGGRGHHGWITFLWPYMEATPIYNEINFHEPWNAPVNSGYFRLKVFWAQNPSIPDDSLPMAFGLAHYSANSHLLAANSCVRLPKVDEPANTFLIGELGGDFVPWGSPWNWRPLNGLNAIPRTYGRSKNIGGHFLMVEGSVRWFDPELSSEILEALRGPDLARESAVELTIRRPESFPVPPDAWVFAWERLSDRTRISGKKNSSGEFIEIDLSGHFKEHGQDPNDADLALLKRFPRVRKLNAAGDFTDAGLRSILQLREVTDLTIASNQITDEGLLVLSQLKTLTSLHIRGQRITAAGLTELRKQLPDCNVNQSP